jgi:cytochrome c peroxidase
MFSSTHMTPPSQLNRRQRRLIPMLAALILSSFGAMAGTRAEPIKPVPPTLNADPARAGIGRLLFHDPRLSGNGRISCASCHDLASGGADGKRFSTGFDGALTAVNTPTVLNAALNFKQFWDGRAVSLEAQVEAVIESPAEMGSNWKDVVAKVSQDAGYASAFAAAYTDGVTKANIQNAIATFQRSLITPQSRFDRYLRGETDAITAQEKAGYAKFKQFGCVACHQGVNVGGNMFQKFGVMGDYIGERGNPTPADLGRYAMTGRESDRQVFKVPSLRNVALTAPYFHDGSAASLEAAVAIMFKYQLGRVPSRDDLDCIVKFLHTLTALPAATGAAP